MNLRDDVIAAFPQRVSASEGDFVPGAPTKPIFEATVCAVHGKKIEVQVGEDSGIVVLADIPLLELGSLLSAGAPLRVRLHPGLGPGNYTVQGLPNHGRPHPVPTSSDAPKKEDGLQPPFEATVVEVSPKLIRVEVHGQLGRITTADRKISELAKHLRPGQRIPVRHHKGMPNDCFAVKGLLEELLKRIPKRPHKPRPWERVAAQYSVGDIVRGRVDQVRDRWAKVEVLDGVFGKVHISNVDASYVNHPSEFLAAGDLLPVKILEMNAKKRSLELSRSEAIGRIPRAGVALSPGGQAFLEAEWAAKGQPPSPEVQRTIDGLRAELRDMDKDAQRTIDGLRSELRGLERERERSNAEHDKLKQRNQKLSKELKAEKSAALRLQKKQARELPSASETAFLAAVRSQYAQVFNETERFEYPLLRMTVGSQFLDRLQRIEGISHDKIVEVCAQVGSDRAKEIAGREVHRLRGGAGGAGHKSRDLDKAAAWRCSLQRGSPAARRLHWWHIPGPDGGCIEFAGVGLHDEVDIPE